jgi:hypothetical protein
VGARALFGQAQILASARPRAQEPAVELICLDHVHFSVPDLARAKEIYGPFLNGRFTPG